MEPKRMADTGQTIAPDPVIEAYKKDVDRTLLRENLKLSVAERLHNLQSFINALAEIRGVANRR